MKVSFTRLLKLIFFIECSYTNTDSQEDAQVWDGCLGFEDIIILLTCFLIFSQSVMKVPKRPEYDSSARHCVGVGWVVERACVCVCVCVYVCVYVWVIEWVYEWVVECVCVCVWWVVELEWVWLFR